MQSKPRLAEPSGSSFAALIARVRKRDAEAAAELVRQYEPALRRVARVRLRDDRMQRTLDSLDVCQSVLGSFFVRAALGEYQIETVDDLLKLLATIVRNKVASHVRKETADRRDHRRLQAGDLGVRELASAEPTASRVVEARELLAACWQRLTPRERQIAELRAAGEEWADIAARFGDSPEAVRKRFRRAVDELSAWFESQ